MSNELTFKFPEAIKIRKQDKLEKRIENAHESDKELITKFFNPLDSIKTEKSALKRFLETHNNELKSDFIDLIESFEDNEVYERFLASILVYNRIDDLPDGTSKFLYLCIAVEAAMHFKSNYNKNKTTLFKSFFKKNLSEESKLKMISRFRNKEVKNIVKSQDLISFKNSGAEIKKTKTDEYMPSCYRIKDCSVENSMCYPDNFCYLKDKFPEKIDEQLDHILNFLYAKRGDFVHEGIGFSIDSKYDKPISLGLIDLYHDPTKKEDVEAHFILYIEDLFNFYEEALLNHLKLGRANVR